GGAVQPGRAARPGAAGVRVAGAGVVCAVPAQPAGDLHAGVRGVLEAARARPVGLRPGVGGGGGDGTGRVSAGGVGDVLRGRSAGDPAEPAGVRPVPAGGTGRGCGSADGEGRVGKGGGTRMTRMRRVKTDQKENTSSPDPSSSVASASSVFHRL